MLRRPTNWRQLLRSWLTAEFYLSALPFAAFAANHLVLMRVVPPLGLLVYIAFFLYVLPAFLLVANVCGHPLVEPQPGNFVPIPADSPSSWGLLFAAHAAIVTALFGIWRTAAHPLRRRRDRP